MTHHVREPSWMGGPDDHLYAPSNLVEEVLGILEEHDTPTKLNDAIVAILEEYERMKEEAIQLSECLHATDERLKDIENPPPTEPAP